MSSMELVDKAHQLPRSNLLLDVVLEMMWSTLHINEAYPETRRCTDFIYRGYFLVVGFIFDSVDSLIISQNLDGVPESLG